MIVAINGNRHQENHLADIERLVSDLMRRDNKVVMSDRFLDYLVGKLGSRFAIGIHHIRLSEQPLADLAVAIGGDGAFLKTAAWVGDSATPVAGINTGHLGFLAAFSFDRPGGDNRPSPRRGLRHRGALTHPGRDPGGHIPGSQRGGNHPGGKRLNGDCRHRDKRPPLTDLQG